MWAAFKQAVLEDAGVRATHDAARESLSAKLLQLPDAFSQLTL